MELSCPLGTIRRVPQEKFLQKPYNKYFIDQACTVKMAGYWPRSFFCVVMGLDYVSAHNHAKKELGQYPAILTSHLVNNPYLVPYYIASSANLQDESNPGLLLATGAGKTSSQSINT